MKGKIVSTIHHFLSINRRGFSRDSLRTSVLIHTNYEARSFSSRYRDLPTLGNKNRSASINLLTLLAITGERRESWF